MSLELATLLDLRLAFVHPLHDDPLDRFNLRMYDALAGIVLRFPLYYSDIRLLLHVIRVYHRTNMTRVGLMFCLPPMSDLGGLPI
jgi:hypothetical protein